MRVEAVNRRCLADRLTAGGLAVALLASGCVSVRASEVSPLQAQSVEQITRDHAACEEMAGQTAGSGPLVQGPRYGLLGGGLWALRGAADGARWVLWTGGNAGEGAWIGAAVGAGLGTIVGLAAGIQKGIEAQRQYRSAYESCLSERGYEVARKGA